MCLTITAQFWNIPISPIVQNGDTFLELFDPSNPKYRFIPAEVIFRTWSNIHTPCYYVGDSQGGPSHFRNPIQSVIEGGLYDYETASLFATQFTFAAFEGSVCV